MPKFIGKRIPGARQLDSNAVETPDLVQLSYSQARLLSPSDVYASLDTTDAGTKSTLAKRWYRWFASPDAIRACPKVTQAMRQRVRHHADRFRRIAAEVLQQKEV